jgi:AcrR family transcriptional regulator
MRALPGHAARQPPGSSKPVTRDAAPADQRRRILRATAELVSKRGYNGTTIELIIRRAKVGYATFYKNFADKESCFLALLEQSFAAGEERVRKAYEEEPAPWPTKVAAALTALFATLREHPAEARICVVEALTAGPVAVARYEAALQSFGQILRPGRELNPRGAELPETLEDTLAGGVLWIAYQRFVIGEADRLADYLPEAVELVLRPYVGEAEAVKATSELAARPVPSA